MLDIRVDTSQLKLIADGFVATEKQIEKAMRSTLGKMAKWTKTRSVRGLAKDLQIPQKIIRRRVRILKKRGSSISIFYGQNPAAMIYLNPKKTATGVTAAGREVAGAFIAKGSHSGRQVFKRVGKARLPIAGQEVVMKETSDRYLENEFIDSAEFAAQFYKVFEHELQWQTRT